MSKKEFDFSSIGSCCDPWDQRDDAIDVCPDCGEPIDDEGDAVVGCSYSPKMCDTCGSSPCDGSC